MPKYPGRIVSATPPSVSLSGASGVWTLEEVAQYEQAGTWPVATGGNDPYFNQTVLLLHGDGTNGAQNNTFLDSGTANGGVGFTITRNPATGPNAPTQGTFSPFSAEPGKWGNYFDGTTDNLSTPSNAAFTLSGDFTIEAWVYRTVAGVSQGIFTTNPSVTNTGVALVITSGNVLSLRIGPDSSVDILSDPNTFPLNAWTHCAATRSGNNLTLYKNGVSVNTTTTSKTPNTTTGVVGRFYSDVDNFYLTGYISNLRVVKGRAVYTGNFTPPTTPLGATSGGTNPPQGTETSLLTCQSNRFVDNGVANSGTGFTITRNGDVRVTPFSPFAPTAAYSAGTNGGSGYFDGTSDYLSLTNASALQLTNSTAFTLEMWVYFISTAGSPFLFTAYNASSPFNGYALRFLSTNGVLEFWDGTNWNSFGVAPIVNAWNHIAVSYEGSGTTRRFFLNGAQAGSAGTVPASINYTSGTVYVGSAGASNYLNGYIAGLRLLKGTGYSSISVPTEPPTAITNTSLLLNFTNAGIIDNTGKNVLETVGNAQVDTSVKKFGTGSMKFDGTGNYLLMNGSENFAFGSGDFTVEFWYYSNNSGVQQIIYDSRPTSTQGAYLVIYKPSNNVIATYVSSGQRLVGTTALASNTWYHIAITKSGTSGRLFINGVQDGSTFSDTFSYLNGTNRPIIGADGATLGSSPLNGYIDDLRITKGVARYPTEPFPTAPFPDF